MWAINSFCGVTFNVKRMNVRLLVGPINWLVYHGWRELPELADEGFLLIQYRFLRI